VQKLDNLHDITLTQIVMTANLLISEGKIKGFSSVFDSKNGDFSAKRN
jgi:hypothetical protein